MSLDNPTFEKQPGDTLRPQWELDLEYEMALAQPGVRENGWRVGDLLEFLSHHKQDALVVLSSDSEGNRYSPLRVVAASSYAPETAYNGELDDDMGGTPCIALWPTN